MPAIAKSITTDAYMLLINEFPLRRLKNVADHTNAKRIVLQLSVKKLDRGACEYLDNPLIPPIFPSRSWCAIASSSAECPSAHSRARSVFPNRICLKCLMANATGAKPRSVGSVNHSTFARIDFFDRGKIVIRILFLEFSGIHPVTCVSMCVTCLATSGSSFMSPSTVRTACSTVVWSRPPK